MRLLRRMKARITLLEENMDRQQTPRFLQKRAGFFIAGQWVSRVFMPIHIKRQAQDGFFGEQIDISGCYRNDDAFPLASYTDPRVGVWDIIEDTDKQWLGRKREGGRWTIRK